MSLLQSIIPFGKSRFGGPPPEPDTPFFVIGDVHGRLDLLLPLLDKLIVREQPIVLVGDYIDRGPDSAFVLQTVFELERANKLICLRGNHEEMLLKFLSDPEKHGRRWLRNGGQQTLESFDIPDISPNVPDKVLIEASQQMTKAIAHLQPWLLRLPYIYRNGNVAVVHAGAAPRIPLDEQDADSLSWGHPDFDHIARNDGQWIIHGHTIVPEPIIGNGKAAIDTGAYVSNTLTAVEVTSGMIKPVD